MNHWLLVPVLLPLMCGALLMTSSRSPLSLTRSVSAVSVVVLLLCAVYLLMTASNGQIQVYALGNWSAPFGIVLLLDRLSALMLLVTAVLAVFVHLLCLAR